MGIGGAGGAAAIAAAGETGPPAGGGELILIAEDDPDVAQLVRRQLEREGFRATVNPTGAGLLSQAAELRPALLILDLMLPVGSGLNLLRQLRREPALAELPVIVLTALAEEADRLRGFALGASDYVTKPFSPRELAARVRARLRESFTAPDQLLAGPLRLDLGARRAWLAAAASEPARSPAAEQELELSDTEFRMLAFLLRHPGRALTRREIVDGVWAPRHFITERTVDVYMLRLRAKLDVRGGDRQFLTAVRGVGYRFDP